MANNKKVACLIGEGFEDSEFRKPYDALREAGYEIDLIGHKAGEQISGKQGKEKIKATHGIDDVRPAQYAALFIPGGHSPDKLRADERFVRFVRDFDGLDRPIAAVCHGPQLLIAARVVEGRTLTAWQTIQRDLELIPGVNVRDEAVVRDGKWITSRKPEDLEKFSDAMLDALEREPAVAEGAAPSP